MCCFINLILEDTARCQSPHQVPLGGGQAQIKYSIKTSKVKQMCGYMLIKGRRIVEGGMTEAGKLLHIRAVHGKNDPIMANPAMSFFNTKIVQCRRLPGAMI